MKPLKIAILVYAKPDVGLGHWYRSRALAKAARDAGHFVWILGNQMTHGEHFFQVRENEPSDLLHVLHQLKLDVLVMDLQNKVPDYIYEMVGKTKTVILNGVGRDWEQHADATIIQGYTDIEDSKTFGGPKYVILRPELFRFAEAIQAAPQNWFVFGGAKDKLGLLPAFMDAMPQAPANLIVSKFISSSPEPNFPGHIFYETKDEAIFPIMATSKDACIAMGMIAWELSVFRKSIYAFSWSDGHLKFAKRMEEAGLLKAWDGVGLPSPAEITEFLSTPFGPTGQPPDDQGVNRVIKIIEEVANV